MSGQEQDSGDVVYVHIENFLKAGLSGRAYGAALDLFMCIYWPLKQPFEFDPPVLAARLNGMFPRRKYTPSHFSRAREEIARLFIILDDGRWAPSPEFFSLTDGNAELLAADSLETTE
jgi:hypothetical protein